MAHPHPQQLTRCLTLCKAGLALLLAALALPAFSACWDPVHATSRYSFGGWVVDNDPASKLMWDGCPFGRTGFICGDGTTTTLDWSSATVAAQNATVWRYNDWRLPTEDELLTLVAPACSPSINGFFFQATPLAAFWTQTSDPADLGSAKTVNFFNGFVGSANRTNPFAVRLVRGGLPLNMTVAADQTIVFGAIPALAVGATANLNFSASSSPNSGNPIRVASTTPTVCSVDAAGVVTALATGTCSITANRYGRVNAGVNYAPASPVSLAFDVGCWLGGSTPKPNSLYVLQPGAQNSGGTVVDLETNLMWKQCTEGLTGNGGTGCGGGTINFLNWDDSNTQATTSRFASYSDWRVPTLAELQSLVPSGCAAPGPTINQVVFPNTNPYFYWSSSLAAVASGLASFEDFIGGTTTYGNRLSGLNLRLVRAGQSFDTLTPTPQTLSFAPPPALELGDDPFVVARSSVPNSGNRVIYGTTTPTVCTVVANNGFLAFTATAQIGDMCTVTANQFGSYAGGKNYAPATQATQNIINKKVVQALDFGAAPLVIVGGSGGLAATSNLGLTPITFTSATAATCTVSGSTVTGIALGTCTIQADQAGNASIASASAQTSFNVALGCTLRMGAGGPLAATREGLILLRAMLGLTGTLVTQGTGVTTLWPTLRDQLNANCGTSFQ